MSLKRMLAKAARGGKAIKPYRKDTKLSPDYTITGIIFV